MNIHAPFCHTCRYQQVIYECSLCAHPINDGTDRLRTKSHDCPKGELRQVPKGPYISGLEKRGQCVVGTVHLGTKSHECPKGQLRQVPKGI